ncbi:MAG: hypothetical protein A2452_06040 [Candidatus Firestonebacteria bacterium RIFOXYC2_FULL_39_67]|nr:MAG: hypothetical protein A2536_12425 [Candidatus Firestonebacteria bacterium RIFOXYD2_FULL_39_29]OGF56647.1 MAG: hypothetical protein A2452_06040 [Candidatus Firestonebacteria bacterium RIFOXYC2_FULL_39_67]OGF57123.1 MAG: hypothetical protein A2497_04585 [Candidatus Firestonebacteria bacterium RifOxyC12_full_39_7]
MSKKYFETHSRSILKAISWRTTGTLDTIVISFVLTGKIKLALSIGLAELATKTVLYYLHERLWNKIKFGRKEEPVEYNI